MAADEISPELQAFIDEHGWRAVYRVIQEKMTEDGEWAGVPIPIRGLKLVLQNRWPRREAFERFWEDFQTPAGSVRVCRDRDVAENCRIRNRWYSERLRQAVTMAEVDGKVECFLGGGFGARRVELLANTLAASDAWDAEAECKAREKLADLIPLHAFRHYLMTGMFLETSPRSGVTYMFRSLRPTLALRPGPDGTTMRCLAALCLHPIGFYAESWGGVMVPTDDLLAHLLLMRGDEAKFWRQANQHDLDSVEGGL